MSNVTSKLDKCVAVVTGAANGIGKALCDEIATRGGKVAVADIELEKAEAVAQALRDRGADAIALYCDVAHTESVTQALATVESHFGAVNLLCCNAGVIMPGAIDRTRENDMRWMYEVNVFGVVRCVQAFLPLLRAAEERGEFSQILITGSENSLGVPVVGPCSIYTSTKHAVLGLADTLRRDLKDTAIGVTLVCPAVVNTEIWNAGRNRPEALGGPKQAPAAIGELFKDANTPESVAIVGLDGCEAGEFLVLPHPEVASFTRARASELLAALAACEQRG